MNKEGNTVQQQHHENATEQTNSKQACGSKQLLKPPVGAFSIFDCVVQLLLQDNTQTL